MSENVFEIFNQNQNIEKINNKQTEKIKESSFSPFTIVSEIFRIINTQTKNYDLDLDDISNSDLSFIKYILNHDLAYNKFTRKFLDIFYKTSYSLDNIDYIHWFISFMINNGIKFPMFMLFYKFGINNEYSKYKDYILKNYELDEEELLDLESTLKLNNKDIYFAVKK